MGLYGDSRSQLESHVSFKPSAERDYTCDGNSANARDETVQECGMAAICCASWRKCHRDMRGPSPIDRTLSWLMSHGVLLAVQTSVILDAVVNKGDSGRFGPCHRGSLDDLEKNLS
jgi:hypothetical protein